MSQKNEFKVVSFKAKRGTIFDRNGITLAYDAAEYKLTYTPSTPYPDKLTALLGRYNIAHLNSIDINKKQLYRLIEVGTNGTETTITIKKFLVNGALPDNFFVFDEEAYSDYYIDRF